MMRWEVTDDLNWLKLVEYDDELDLRQVEVSFTKQVAKWHFKKKQFKNKGWDGQVNFLQKKRYLPVGLWMELLAINEKFTLGITIEGLDKIIDPDVKYPEFKAWIEEFFKDGIGPEKKMPRDYQIEASYKIAKFKISSQELATNAGKTLITFMALAYLMSKGKVKRFLMIVPTTGLVIQGFDDFQEYGAYRLDMKFQQVHGEEKVMRSDANVVMGTYQSLVKKDPEYLASFDMIFVDEAHSTPAVSIKKIVAQCTSWKYRFGLSGTLTSAGEDTADFYTIQMCLGPMVGKISPDFLIKNKYAAAVNVKIIRMKYLPPDTIERLYKLRQNKSEFQGTDIYNIERRLIIQSRERLNFIVDMILKTTKNALVLFQSVEEGYGRAIYDLLREKSSTKEVFYIDGDTKDDQREEYKLRMKTGDNKLLIASSGTFSTGISINNLHSIFLVEARRSENIVKQSIGRGMRLLEGKDGVNIIDFVDDFSYKGKINYSLEHSDERIRIYEKEKFPYKIYDIDLTR